MGESGKNVKRVEKQKGEKNGTEIRVLETRYGLRVLVRQGGNKVWLSEAHLATLFNALLARVFGGKEGVEK